MSHHEERTQYQIALFDNERGNVEFVNRKVTQAVTELGVAQEWLEGLGDQTVSQARERGLEAEECVKHALIAMRDVSILVETLSDSLQHHVNEYRVDAMKVGNLVDAVDAAVRRWR